MAGQKKKQRAVPPPTKKNEQHKTDNKKQNKDYKQKTTNNSVRSHNGLNLSFGGMAGPELRTHATDLDNAVASEILKNNVAAGLLKPQELWKLTKLTKSGVTSDWAKIKSTRPLLAAILEATKGRSLRLKKFHKQFRTFLKTVGVEWCLVDSNRVCYSLRAMLRTLCACKRDGRRPPPAHAGVASLIDLATSK